MELIPLCTFTIELAGDRIFPVGNGPAGSRLIFEVESGRIEGERLNATMKGQASADWMTLDPNGVATLDVRTMVETDDGALIFIQYRGRADFSAGPGSAPVYTAPTFETSDERYAWLNTIQAVAKGEGDGLTLVYEVAEVR